MQHLPRLSGDKFSGLTVPLLGDPCIDAPERDALKSLSKVEGRPINQVLIEAIRSYLGQKGRRERTLEANLKTLREYRRKDPGPHRSRSFGGQSAGRVLTFVAFKRDPTCCQPAGSKG